MKVSVALCTYNGELYIADQLYSITAQTHPVDEIILCDDGSSDSTLTIARQIQEQGSPIQIHCNTQRLGFVANFAKAIQTCTGDIIFLCDQDDLWKEDKVALMLTYFQSNPKLLLIFSDGELINETGNSLNCRLWQALPYPPKKMPSFIDLLNHDLITGAACAFRRELITHALPFPAHWIHDAWLGIIASALGQIEAIPTTLIAYRQHNNNQIGLRPPTFKQKIQKVFYLMTTAHLDISEKYQPLLTYIPPSHPQYFHILGKIRHLKNRQTGWRIIGIIKETLNGGYSHYANGWQSIIRDIILLIYQTILNIHSTFVVK